MKKNILRLILIVLLCGTFSIIFGFSSQDSEQSGGLSKKITTAVVNFIPKLRELDNLQKEEVTHRMEKVIRKIAHFSIYTVVGFLLMTLVSTYKLKNLDRIAISLIVGVIYASTDEMHQAFIPGRAAQITDVMLDSLGVMLGIALAMTIMEIKKVVCNC